MYSSAYGSKKIELEDLEIGVKFQLPINLQEEFPLCQSVPDLEWEIIKITPVIENRLFEVVAEGKKTKQLNVMFFAKR